MYCQISLQLGQNILSNDISNDFNGGSYGIKSRSLGKKLTLLWSFFFSIVMRGWVMLQNMLGDLIELSVDRISGYCVPRPVQVTRLFGDSG